jgi:acyl transferase domain-containing protein
LARALQDGDRVHAVINAVAVGNDGHTIGLTTPNPVAQARVVRRALDLAGIAAQQIGMVEAHGTGTMIGDPIELRALTRVFQDDTDQRGFCAIGSVKSNIGHLLSAAGIAGLIKALLALEHGEIPATLFCETPNPRFDFAASPFFPNTRLVDWPSGSRVAGVSAFGLGGTNAHLVATAAPEEHSPRREALPAPVFARRWLWWDRTDPTPSAPYLHRQERTDLEPIADQLDRSVVTEDRDHHGQLVASVLDLRFTPASPAVDAPW